VNPAGCPIGQPATSPANRSTKQRTQLLAAALLSALAFTSAHAADAKKPNILIFHIDNSSVGDWGCYGGA
jgi:hypothetical protein